MVIALAIMDTGFKRYVKLDAGEYKENSGDVVRLSVVNQFENTVKNGSDIINYLFNGEKLHSTFNFVN